MDGRGRLAQSVTRLKPRSRPAAASRGLVSRSVRRVTLPLAHLRVPRFTGAVAALLFLSAAAVYGIVKGEHVQAIFSAIKDTADAGANAMGMRIATVSLSGQRQVSRGVVEEYGLGPCVRIAGDDRTSRTHDGQEVGNVFAGGYHHQVDAEHVEQRLVCDDVHVSRDEALHHRSWGLDVAHGHVLEPGVDGIEPE